LKLILLVEGDTERAVLPEFLKRWLDPKLGRPVSLEVVNFGSNGEYLKEVAKMTAKYLNGPKSQEVIAVIGLLDLYGLPDNFFPSDISNAQDRYSWAKQKLEEHVGQAKFRQFFAMHELEAWLLSDPSIFPRDIEKEFPRSIRNPESVNFNEPPARLLERLYQRNIGKRYKKKVDGPKLFRKLDPEIAYQKCPRLKEMLDEMLRLAKAAETDHADTQHSTSRTPSPRPAARRSKDRPRPRG
jgi:uncharacterized protein DUF4276